MQEYRKKLRRYENPNQLRFLTFSCYKRLPLFSNDSIKDAFVFQIDTVRSTTHFRLLAWVIMPEHVHLMIQPSLPDFPVTKVLWHLKRHFSQRILVRWREMQAPILNRIQTTQGTCRFWQHGGGYDRNIRSEKEQIEKIRYIHENPIRRGIVTHSIDWKWSSARWYAGDRTGL